MIGWDKLPALVELLLMRRRARAGSPRASLRAIAETLEISKTTVLRYDEALATCKVAASRLKSMTPAQLAEQFNGPRALKARPDYRALLKECKRLPTPSVRVLHDRYFERELSAGNHEPLSYAQFVRDVGQLPQEQQLALRKDYTPGEVVYVDYAGKPGLSYADAAGKTVMAKLFVGALGFSQMVFATCVPSEALDDWLLVSTRMLHFFQGSPRSIVPDNLKSAITKPRPWAVVNPAFKAWAAHYRIVVDPARRWKPRDKGLVENAVKHVQNRLAARLGAVPFESLQALNEAVNREMQAFNAAPLTGRKVSRWQQFEVERKKLRPLPARPFRLALRTLQQKVPPSYLVKVDGHGYSVPPDYVGQTVTIGVSELHVEVCCEGQLIAVHDLVPAGKIGAAFTRHPDHATEAHRAVMWPVTVAEVKAWAASVGPHLAELMERHFRRTHPESGLPEARSAQGLQRRHKPEVLEWAAAMALRLRPAVLSRLPTLLQKPPKATDPVVLKVLTPKAPRAAHEGRSSIRKRGHAGRRVKRVRVLA